jgi:uncharacterized protein YjbI with pentapeptide repeats
MVMQNNLQTDLNHDQSSVTANESLKEIVINNHNHLPAEDKSPVETWTAIAGVLIAAAVAFSGCQQYKATTAQQESDSADKAIETREQVLTDYGKAISELMTKNKEETSKEEYISNENKRNIARGQTFIALRRLNVSDKPKSDKGWFNTLLVTLHLRNPDENSKNEDESKVDAGKLKGLLIRYLYELRLIDNYEFNEQGVRVLDQGDIYLGGADIDNVVLEDAWLPNIDLTGAWLRNGNFINADLRNANFTGANFTGANFTGSDLRRADLRFANLTNANLTRAKLDDACYVEGTEAKYFPAGFQPETFNMIAIPEEQSDSNNSNFQPCTTP